MPKDKVIFLSSKNPFSRKDWSGIPFFLYQALSQKYDVEYVPLPQFRLIKLLGYYFSKLFFIVSGRKYVSDYGLLMAILYGVVGTTRLKNNKAKFLFSPAGLTETAFLRTSIPVISYSDCSTLQLIGYYPALNGVCRLSKYEIELVERLALKKKSYAIFSSQWASSFVANQYKRSCVTIPFGANIDSRSESNALSIASMNSCNLLFVGVDWIRKGGDVALKVHQKLLEKGIYSSLTMVGSIPNTDTSSIPNLTVISILNKDTEEGLAKLSNLFCQSHFLILPTRADCTPIVIAEAYSFALPVLASDTGGISSMVLNDITGKLFDYDDVDGYVAYICHMLNKPHEYQQIRAMCSKKYDDIFNWNSWRRELDRIVHDL